LETKIVEIPNGKIGIPANNQSSSNAARYNAKVNNTGGIGHSRLRDQSQGGAPTLTEVSETPMGSQKQMEGILQQGFIAMGPLDKYVGTVATVSI